MGVERLGDDGFPIQLSRC